MASNRAKLSLRRAKKMTGNGGASHSTNTSEPHPSGGVVSEHKSHISRNVEELVERDSATTGGDVRGGAVCEDEDGDFRPCQPLPRAGQGRKRKQLPTSSYTADFGQEELQLAMALSASLHPPHTTPMDPPPGKRNKRGKGRANDRDFLPSSMIMTSSAEAQKIIAQKASAMLQEGMSSGPGQTAPALQPSQLAKKLEESGPTAKDSSTLWEMAGYAEEERESKFLVPALDLSPRPVSSQPSPAAHVHPSLIPHRSHSPQPSTPQPPAPPTWHPPSSRPSPPPTLPRGVQTLLSDLSSLVGSQLCSDVVITVADGRGIPAHSAILACRCPLLAERLFHSLDKPVHLDFRQFDRATVVSFLRYLYTGTIPHQNGMNSVTMLAMSLGMMEPSLLTEEGRDSSTRRTQGFTSHTQSTELPPTIMTRENSSVLPQTSEVIDAIGVSRPSPHPPSTLSPPSLHTSLPAPAARQEESTPTPPPQLEGSPSLSPDMTHGSTTQSHFVSSSQQEVVTPPQQAISPSTPTLTVSSSPRPLHERISCHVPLMAATPPIHCPSPTDKQEDPPLSPSRKDPAASPSFTERDSFDWNISWSSTAVAGTDKHITSKGTEYDDIVAVAVCDADIEQDVGYNQSNSEIVTVSATPAPLGQRPVLESDVDITPMPDYHSMATPHLKGECARFGVRALPKRKMIAKLEEIYDYTHPLVDADDNVLATENSVAKTAIEKVTERGRGRGRGKAKAHECPPPSSQVLSQSFDELVNKVKEVITMDTELYEDMLLYKPLELCHIQSRLRAAALSVSRETLMDVLDHLCVTFTVPRQQNQQRTT